MGPRVGDQCTAARSNGHPPSVYGGGGGGPPRCPGSQTQGAQGPMGPRRAGGGRKPCPTSKDYLLLSVLLRRLFCILCNHYNFKVISKEIPNLLLPSTYFKAGPTLIEWPVEHVAHSESIYMFVVMMPK